MNKKYIHFQKVFPIEDFWKNKLEIDLIDEKTWQNISKLITTPDGYNIVIKDIVNHLDSRTVFVRGYFTKKE